MRRLKHETVTTGTDGQRTTTSKTYSVRTDSDNFFMTFMENLAGLLKIKNATDFRVLSVLNTMAEFNTGRVVINSSDRKIITESLNLDTQVLSNSLARLKEAGLIVGQRGIYEINPLIFWRGTTDERKKVLREKGFEVKIKFLGGEQFDNEK
jgi:hypothetical protein